MLFEQDLDRNLLQLCFDLNNNYYSHGAYTHKIINEKKRRDIHVADVRDRVVHRLLYNYLVPIVDPKFDYDVWSCRPGKGLHACLMRTQQLLQKYPSAWVWRADITKFFDNIDKNKLKKIMRRYFSDEVALSLLDIVIDSYNYQTDRQTEVFQLAI